MKILVIGGTGLLGRPVVRELINYGHEVTLFTTNASIAVRLFPKTMVIEGDIKHIEKIETAMLGQDAVYINLSIPLDAKVNDWNPEIDGLKNILTAAQRTKINQIGYLSPLIRNYTNKKNWWLLEHKKQAIEMIQNSTIPHFIFTASSFMENFLYSSRRGNAINTIGKSLNSNYYISGSDYGKQVAKAFSLVPHNKEYFIQGPQALNPKDAVMLFTTYYTKEKLKPGYAPMGTLKLIGCFNNQINNVAHLMTAINEFPETFMAKETWEILGTPTTTVKDYAIALSK